MTSAKTMASLGERSAPPRALLLLLGLGLLMALPEGLWAASSPQPSAQPPAGAARQGATNAGLELRLEFTNDDLSGSTYPDDLYSFGGFLALSGQRFGVRLEERGFTDKVGNSRFDETYLTALGFWPPEGRRFAGWRATASLGVVRVGRGLAGQPVQNRVHRWIGDELVEADYAAVNDLYPHLGISLSGPLGQGAPVLRGSEGWVEMEASPGFRTSLAVGLHRSGQQRGLFRFGGAVGLRWTETQLDALKPWVDDLAPTVRLTTYFRQRYSLTWSYNAYGTGDLHWHFGFATPLGRRNLPPRD